MTVIRWTTTHNASTMALKRCAIHNNTCVRVFTNTHRRSVVDLRQASEDLTELVTLEPDKPFILHPHEFVLGITHERVGLPVLGLRRDALGHGRVRGANGLPVAEVPGLQLLDRDAMEDAPRDASRGAVTLHEARCLGHAVELSLELDAVVIITVHHDQDPGVIAKPRIRRAPPRYR